MVSLCLIYLMQIKHDIQHDRWLWRTVTLGFTLLEKSPEMHFENKVFQELQNIQLLFIFRFMSTVFHSNSKMFQNGFYGLKFYTNQSDTIDPLTWPSLPSHCRPSEGCRDTTSAPESRADRCWWSGTQTGRWGWAGPWGSTVGDPLRGAGGQTEGNV